MFRFSMDLPGRPRGVPVVVGRGALGSELSDLPRWGSGVLIADRAVHAAHGSALDRLTAGLVAAPGSPYLIDAGEDAKDAARLVDYWTELDARGLDRNGVIVVAGGGSVLDLGVFLAATWLRGVDCVVVPTTLLAQVDAGLGGKCGVNLGHAKNQIGAIWQPRAIVADVDILQGLADDEVRSGSGELVKTALLAGGDLVDQVMALDHHALLGSPGLEAVVGRCLEYKASVVAADEREGGRRAVLNLGHTVGHVIESLALEQGCPMPHGVAVAVGILAEAVTFSDDPGLHDLIRSLLDGAGLPRTCSVAFDDNRAVALLARDKKRDGATVTVPVLASPGIVQLQAVTSDRLIDACRAAVDACAS